MWESLDGKRIQSKKSDKNLHLIACWAQKTANWLDTFRGWLHSQKQIFSFKEDIFHLQLFHGFRPKSIWYEENLIWLFIQIILPALIATLLPRGNRGQRDPGSHALKALDWDEVGGTVGAEHPDQSDLSLTQAKNRAAKNRDNRASVPGLLLIYLSSIPTTNIFYETVSSCLK